MASMATSEMIFFIATLILSVSVVGVLGGQTAHLSLGMQNSAQGASDQIQTNFEIINDPSSIPYNNGYVFYIKNTGESPIYFTNSTVNVLINGTLLSGNEVTMITPGGNGEIMPSQVGEIVVNLSLPSGYNEITVSLSDGLSKNMEFQI
jgi:flagellar protein FlaG